MHIHQYTITHYGHTNLYVDTTETHQHMHTGIYPHLSSYADIHRKYSHINKLVNKPRHTLTQINMQTYSLHTHTHKCMSTSISTPTLTVLSTQWKPGG